MKCGEYKVLWSRVNLKTLIFHVSQILNINHISQTLEHWFSIALTCTSPEIPYEVFFFLFLVVLLLLISNFRKSYQECISNSKLKE